MEDVVVVGAGLAAHRLALELRRSGFAGRITIVGDEPHLPYDRPPLSKQVLRGEISADALAFPVDDLDVRWRLGVAAVGLDADAHEVTLADNSVLAYDRLVVATGRSARPWPGPVPAAGIHVIRTLDDTLRFRDEAVPGRRVVIVGAGFVGCETAGTLRDKGVDSVTVIDPAPTPMSILGPDVGRLAADYHVARGVDLMLGTSIRELREVGGRVSAVVIDDGRVIDADVVLVAIGSTPNTAWTDGSGIALERGAIRCSDTLFAEGVSDVLAVGDVAAFPHPLDGSAACIEHWSNARETAEVAVHNMLAVEASSMRRHAPVPTFWSDQYDLKIKSAGFLADADSFEIREFDARRPAMVVEARREDALVGAIVVNRNRAIIDYTRSLASAVSV